MYLYIQGRIFYIQAYMYPPEWRDCLDTHINNTITPTVFFLSPYIQPCI